MAEGVIKIIINIYFLAVVYGSPLLARLWAWDCWLVCSVSVEFEKTELVKYIFFVGWSFGFYVVNIETEAPTYKKIYISLTRFFQTPQKRSRPASNPISMLST